MSTFTSDSVEPLQKLCFDAMCKNFDLVFRKKRTPRGATSGGDYSDDDLVEYTPQHLPPALSEMLFHYLIDESKLDDNTISIFDAKFTRLRNIHLSNSCNRCHKLTEKGLAVLAEHQLVSFEYSNGYIGLKDLVAILGDNLKYFGYTRITRSMSYAPIMDLRNLEELSVFRSCFTNENLQEVCENLPNLRALNVSGTHIDTIAPLLLIKDKLTKLSIFFTEFAYNNTMMSILYKLSNLTFLEINGKTGTNTMTRGKSNCNVNYFLRHTDILPNLVHLDLSGNKNMHFMMLKSFVLAHKKLKFLGLMGCHMSAHAMFRDDKHEHYRPDLKVIGDSSGEQLLCALQTYQEHPILVVKIINALSGNLVICDWDSEEFIEDVVQLIVKSLLKYKTNVEIQIRGINFLVALIDRQFTIVSVEVLSGIAEVALQVLENFNEPMMTKKALRLLSTDEVIQSIEPNLFRIVKLVADCLFRPHWEESYHHIQKICLYAMDIGLHESVYKFEIVEYIMEKFWYRKAYFGAKISTFMRLLRMLHPTLKAWSTFLSTDGVGVLCSMLRTMRKEDRFYETFQVLELVNELAEQRALHRYLLVPQMLVELKNCLGYCHVFVSFYAARVIAHLANYYSDEKWDMLEKKAPAGVRREKLVELLGKTIAKWNAPRVEIVIYKSFRVFIPLLKNHRDMPICYLAVWTIHHLCMKCPKRYCKLVIDDNIPQILKEIDERYRWRYPRIVKLITEISLLLLFINSPAKLKRLTRGLDPRDSHCRLPARPIWL